MGMRYRKSLKLGPLRFTLSKSGLSASVGVKGLRVTKMANGRTRTTVSLPGTGISYVKDSSAKAARGGIAPEADEKRAPRLGWPCVWFGFCALTVVGAFYAIIRALLGASDKLMLEALLVNVLWLGLFGFFGWRAWQRIARLQAEQREVALEAQRERDRQAEERAAKQREKDRAEEIMSDGTLLDLCEMIAEREEVSTAELQRLFGLGYSNAGRLMDFLAKIGLVGEYNGGAPRRVLMTPEDLRANVHLCEKLAGFPIDGVLLPVSYSNT